LQVLVLDLVIKELGNRVAALDTSNLENALQHLLETLEVPVLVDARADDLSVENILGFLGQKVAQIV